MFVQTIADIKKTEDLEIFFKDFLKETEYEMYVKRLAIAYWLKKGRSYDNIRGNLKVSSATIASVQKLMDTAGVRIAMKHIEAEEWANIWSERFKKITGR